MRTVWTILSLVSFIEAGVAVGIAASLGSYGSGYWAWAAALTIAAAFAALKADRWPRKD